MTEEAAAALKRLDKYATQKPLRWFELTVDVFKTAVYGNKSAPGGAFISKIVEFRLSRFRDDHFFENLWRLQGLALALPIGRSINHVAAFSEAGSGSSIFLSMCSQNRRFRYQKTPPRALFFPFLHIMAINFPEIRPIRISFFGDETGMHFSILCQLNHLKSRQKRVI